MYHSLESLEIEANVSHLPLSTHVLHRAYQKRVEQFRAIRIIQRNVQSYLKLRNWPWWRLFTKVKPLLQVTNAEDQKREMEEEIKRLNDRHEKLKFEMEDMVKKNEQVMLYLQHLHLPPSLIFIPSLPPSPFPPLLPLLPPPPLHLSPPPPTPSPHSPPPSPLPPLLQFVAENQRLEDQLREEKFLTQEAEEMRNMLTQKKLELESMLQESETKAEEMEELNQAFQAEKAKLQGSIQQLDEQ